jgi:hypothetical protein
VKHLQTVAPLEGKRSSDRSWITQLQLLRMDINALGGNHSSKPMSIAQVAQHYCETELGAESKKTALTKSIYLRHLNEVILPKWGSLLLNQVVPI